MQSKPELIVVSQNLLGGGSSFHRNMLTNKPDNFFDIKCIYLDPLHWNAKRLEDFELGVNDIIFKFENEPELDISKRLNKHISNREGAIVTNLPEELITLSYFPKSKKTIYFICHDKGFLYLVKDFKYLIDVFIAHNFEIFENIKKILPERLKDIFFIPHGVQIQENLRVENKNDVLNLVFLARHVKIKGIYDLPKINQGLLERNIPVNWTILGDGEESENFKMEVANQPNFRFCIPKTEKEVIDILRNIDIYVLPSSHDGLPVSLLESMSVGCVPIVYNFSEGIKRVISKDIGFVVDLDDVNGIVDKIAKLNQDRNLLSELSKNSSEKVGKEFNIKTQAKSYFDLYKEYKKLKKRRSLTFLEREKEFRKYGFLNFIFRVFRYFKIRLS
jgi:glycosyltransferase involved in cell wall biosynthesis